MKKLPVGKTNAPMRSLTAAMKVLYFGPRRIAPKIIGTKEKPIVIIPVWMVKIRPRTIQAAVRRAQRRSFLAWVIGIL